MGVLNMVKSINKVTLIGFLRSDPKFEYQADGKANVIIIIGTMDIWKDRKTGKQMTCAEFHRVILSNRLAIIGGRYLKKGSKVYIEGRLQSRLSENTSDSFMQTEIKASELQMLDAPPLTKQGEKNLVSNNLTLNKRI